MSEAAVTGAAGSDETGPLLSVEHLTVSYGSGRNRNRVLEAVTAHIGHGEIVGLIGETGSGKTTFARSLLSLVDRESGTISFDGQRLDEFGRAQVRQFRRRGEIQYVFQDPLQSLDPDLSIEASLTEVLRIRGVKDREQLREAAERAFDLVGLPHEQLDRRPASLSGGQRQRAVIARALVTDPKLLICDEPVSALDASNRIQILELFKQLRQEQGISQLFISHDLGSVAGISDWILVLERGVIVEQGPTVDLVSNPQHPYTQLLIRSAPTLTAPTIAAP